MAQIVFRDGVTTVSMRYVESKRNGWYQYRRRIPEDLRAHFNGKRYFVRGLGRSTQSLLAMAVRLTNELEAKWTSLRGKAPLKPVFPADLWTRSPVQTIEMPPRIIQITLTEALELYLRYHPKGKQNAFQAYNNRVVIGVVAVLGDHVIDRHTRKDAEEFRDRLLMKDKTATVRRKLTVLVAVFNKACREKQLQIANPFEGLGIPSEGKDAHRRQPFSKSELDLIATECRNLDDDIRHIAALQLDTGARLAEIVGLRRSDVVLEAAVPHLIIRPFGAVRSLKTAASERLIPLIGDALWASRRALQAHQEAKAGSLWVFPRYSSDHEIKATHASNALNKWLRQITGVGASSTTHSFRHSMRDRLRAAEVPNEIQDVLGGWGTRSMGQSYGQGYPLKVLHDQMVKTLR